MRFFKYLFLIIALFISTYSSANIQLYYVEITPTAKMSSPDAACAAGINYYKKLGQNTSLFTYKIYPNGTHGNCFILYGTETVSSHPILTSTLACPSATQKNFRVPSNVGVAWCESNCQYRLTQCVDIADESAYAGGLKGMACTGISTGSTCGSSSNSGGTSTGGLPTATDTPPTTSAGANQNNDGSTSANNTANSTSNSTNTSTSTSTSTTNSDNTTTTNTTTTNNTTTNTTTTIDLSSLENTIVNIGNKITNAIDSLKGDPNGDPDGTGSASSPAVDTSKIESKLDDVKGKQDSLLDFLKGGDDGVGNNPFGSDAIATEQLTQDSLKTNIFSSNAQCPKDATLSMPIGSRTFSYTFSFSTWCYWLSVFGTFILIASYFGGAYIVVSKS